MLEISQLSAEIEGKIILNGLDLTINKGEVHAIMGPNGSGKSTLAHVLAGHPSYTVTQGNITFQGQEITQASPEERSLAGLFLVFQYPIAIPGATIRHVLRLAYNTHAEKQGKEVLDVPTFQKKLETYMDQLHLSHEVADRALNEGFSGGEKKKLELLQAFVLDQPFVIFDEIDSGLDIDALRVVAEGMNTLQKQGKTLLIITHYKRILEYVTPDAVHVMQHGKITQSGDASLVDEVEKKGYKSNE